MLQSPDLMSTVSSSDANPYYLIDDVTLFSASCSACLLDQLVQFNPSQMSQTVDWIVPADQISAQEAVILSETPEHFVDDIAEMLLFISK